MIGIIRNRWWGQPLGVRHALVLAVVFSAFLGIMPTALAEGKPITLRVLLVVDRANDPLMARIQAETFALGLNVVTSGPSGPLETSAREQRAVAAVRALPSRNGVEVWMADVTTGRTLTRQLVVDERPDGPDNTLVALQTAELLRTGLSPKEDKPAAPSAPPMTIVETPAPTPPRTDAWRFRNGLGGLYSRGGVDTAMQDWVSMQYWWRSAFGVAVAGSLPILRGVLSGPEGRSQVGAYLGALEICAGLLDDDSHWRLTSGVGAGLVYLRTSGQSAPPLTPGSAGALTGVGYARLDLSLKVSRWVDLGLATTAGTTFVPVKIRFAGNQAGTWGGFIMAAFFQLGINW